MSQQFAIPSFIKKEIMPNEQVLSSVTPSFSIFLITYWLNPMNCIFAICTFSLHFWYALYINKNKVLVLTNKRIIGCVRPTLFTKDKLSLLINKIDGIFEDESFWGNVFKYNNLRIDTASFKQVIHCISKINSKEFCHHFYQIHN